MDPTTDPLDTPAAQAAVPTRLALRFTGSGSEYLRIWIVNLLLTIVTLGIYYPWAKVRRLRYFHGNTLVGGQPLGYHAEPRQLLRGHLLVMLMALVYALAGKFSPEAGLVALLLIAAIAPALIMSSLRFRLANTSWHGLRMRFCGSLRGAYSAWLPLLAPVIALFAAGAAAPGPGRLRDWLGITLIVVMLGSFALLPWLTWKVKKYQHDHYAYGPERSTLNVGKVEFYALFLETGGVALLGLLGVVVVAGLFALLAGGLPALSSAGGSGAARASAGVLLPLVAAGLAFLMLQLAPRVSFASRLQNLLWSGTASESLRFRSALRFWPLLRLTLKNWLLVILTLGLYWPFAAVAMARLRLEAVEIELHADPASFATVQRADPGEAAGDAAGDVLDLDIGL